MIVRPEAWRRARRYLVPGALLVGALAGAGLLSFVWLPYDVLNLDVADKLRPPSFDHPFGTDQLGRDVVSLIMIGARNSLGVALAAVVLGLGLGVPLGLLAASGRGWIDHAVMRLSDVVFAFPAVLTAILIMAVSGPSAWNVVIAVGIFNIPVFAKVARGAALVQWELPYIFAARVAGKGAAAISLEHVLPNVAGIITAQAAVQFSMGVIAEAGLSYIGLGVQPPDQSWGRMLNEAQTLIALAPHLVVFPGLAILLAVLGFNLLGEGLHAAFDPRLARR
ncbi:MAG TPA: ABC transporter permease [Rhizomicrobium sp.]